MYYLNENLYEFINTSFRCHIFEFLFNPALLSSAFCTTDCQKTLSSRVVWDFIKQKFLWSANEIQLKCILCMIQIFCMSVRGLHRTILRRIRMHNLLKKGTKPQCSAWNLLQNLENVSYKLRSNVYLCIPCRGSQGLSAKQTLHIIIIPY